MTEQALQVDLLGPPRAEGERKLLEMKRVRRSRPSAREEGSKQVLERGVKNTTADRSTSTVSTGRRPDPPPESWRYVCTRPRTRSRFEL